MTRKQQRLAAIALVFCGIAVATGLSLFAMRGNVTYFKSPTDIITTPPAPNQTIRLGGVVVYGTIEKSGLVTRFVVTDLKNDFPVEFSGIVPDLFKEGKGVVVIGHYTDRNSPFIATQLLAKHDENYMPPDVAKSLKGPTKE